MVNGDAAVLPAEEFGYPRGKNHWASCISVVDPVTEKSVLQKIDLDENEAAVSIATVSFASQDDEVFLVVGTGKDMIVSPRSSTSGFIHVYRFHENGKEIEFIHKTKVEEPPMALLAFQGRLLVGIGKDLNVFLLSTPSQRRVFSKKSILMKTKLQSVSPRFLSPVKMTKSSWLSEQVKI